MSAWPERVCPRCGVRLFTPYGADLSGLTSAEKHERLRVAPFPALSRIDNATYVCSWCGHDEALRDFRGEAPVPPDEWPIVVRDDAL